MATTARTPSSKKTTTTTTKSPATTKPAAKKIVAKMPVAKVPATKAKAIVKKVSAPKAAKPLPAAVKESKAKPVRKSTKKTGVSPEERYHMIATAAYFLAERRGFSGGYEMQDWISAEAEIDTKLKG
jgi:hypothetical protein